MNNEPQTKKQWQSPQVVDLDVKYTNAGTYPHPTLETTFFTSLFPSVS